MKLKGKKISEVSQRFELTGQELLPFAQDGENGSMSIDTIASYAYDKEGGDFTSRLAYDVQVPGVELIADRAEKDAFGNIITNTYVTRSGAKKAMNEELKEQLPDAIANINDGFVTPNMLSEETKQLFGAETITNFPDNEDITVNASNQLTLADKEYNPITYSGMGRKKLRKNMINGVNILTQNMLNKQNTIYIILYDFDLNGEEITIPEGCILDFKGGSFNSGVLNCNNTSITAPPIKIFNDVVLKGSVLNDLVLNNFTKCNDCTQSCYNTSNKIKVIGSCEINEPLLVKTGFRIYGESQASKLRLSANYNGDVKTIFFFDEEGGIYYVDIRNLSFGNCDYILYRNTYTTKGSSVSYLTLKDLTFTSVNKSVIYMVTYGVATWTMENLYFNIYREQSLPAIYFEGYYFNNNKIINCKMNGEGYKNLLKVHSTGECAINTIRDCWLEVSTIEEDSLFDIYCENNILNFHVENNYIERIWKNDKSQFAGIFKISSPNNKIMRNIRFNNNYFNSDFPFIFKAESYVFNFHYQQNGSALSNKIEFVQGCHHFYNLGNAYNPTIIGTVVNSYSLLKIPETEIYLKRNNNSNYISKLLNSQNELLLSLEFNDTIYSSDIQIAVYTPDGVKVVKGFTAGSEGTGNFYKVFSTADEYINIESRDIDGVRNLSIKNISENTFTIRVYYNIVKFE